MVLLKVDSGMALENITLTMAIYMRACGKRIKDMVREYITIKMEKFTEDFIDKVREKVLALLITKMEIDMKESGEMEI